MAPLLWTDLSCQSIRLVGKRHAIAARHVELAFPNHVYEFNSGQDGSGRSKRLEAEHRPGDAFDRMIILLLNIVEILDLSDLDRDVSLCIQLVESCLVGATLVRCHRVRNLVLQHRLVEKAPCCCITFGSQQEIDGFAPLVHRAIEIFSDTFDLDGGLLHPPVLATAYL
jgi:hypothetical protein